jgi:uncharacterized protein YxeA
MPPERKVNPVIATIVVIVLVIGLAVGILVLQNMNNDDSQNQMTPTTTDSQTSTTPVDTSKNYTDGDYTATGSYSTPGGNENITVKVSLKDDVITEVSSDGSATSGNSSVYQKQFLDNYTSFVVGKDVDEVSLSRVSGSSLTSTGFNKAIEAIKADATS